MNYRIIFYIIGWILNIEAAFMLLPFLTGVIYQESALWSFVISGMICLVMGIALTFCKPKRQYFYVKEGYVTVALSWIVLSIMGSLPFLLSGSIEHPIDALFPVSLLLALAFFLLWKTCPNVSFSGAALLTGSAAWECWYFCYRY